MIYSNLKKFGLTVEREQQALQYDGLFIARITRQHRDLYTAVSERGELNALLSGKLVHEACFAEQLPAVGDWVLLDRLEDSGGYAVIRHTLPRASAFTRKAAGTSNALQVVAANIDTVFLCMALNADFNVRRMERYLTIAWDSGATPVIVLTKSDLCSDLQQKLGEIEAINMGADVIVCSAKQDNGYQTVGKRIGQGETVAFIGSSGVGKSTLINRLAGSDLLATQEIRESDAKGRHTTTHRELIVLPSGGIVIDTPGMRELQLYSGDLSKTFEDIEELAAGCRFQNCKHLTEPGCNVRQAIEQGILSEERFASYQKLQRELAYAGLNSHQLEQQKINRMFGSKAEFKQVMRHIKKNARR